MYDSNDNSSSIVIIIMMVIILIIRIAMIVLVVILLLVLGVLTMIVAGRAEAGPPAVPEGNSSMPGRCLVKRSVMTQ